MYECRMDAVIAMCSWYGLDVVIAQLLLLKPNSSSPLFKYNATLHDKVRLMFEIKLIDFRSKHNFPPCDFIVHATCVVPLLRTFEPTLAGCGCRKPCFTTEVEVNVIRVDMAK